MMSGKSDEVRAKAYVITLTMLGYLNHRVDKPGFDTTKQQIAYGLLSKLKPLLSGESEGEVDLVDTVRQTTEAHAKSLGWFVRSGDLGKALETAKAYAEGSKSIATALASKAKDASACSSLITSIDAYSSLSPS